MDTAAKNFQYAKKSHNMVLLNPLLFYYLITSEDLEKLFGQGPINTDNRPLLEFSAPKLIYRPEDPTIMEYLVKKRWLTSKTKNIILEIYSNIDAQIDRAVLNLSFKDPILDMVDLSKATPEQKARYSGIISSYCSENLVEDFSFVSDPELLKMCISSQIKAMQKKINTVQDKDGLFSHLANLYDMSKMPEEAINYYTLAIESNPSNYKSYFNLGNVFAEQNLLDEAIRMYREAIQINPMYAKAFHNLGSLLARQKKLEEAEEILRQSLSLDPESVPSHRVLGNVLKELGRPVEGNKHLEEAERLIMSQTTQ